MKTTICVGFTRTCDEGKAKHLSRCASGTTGLPRVRCCAISQASRSAGLLANWFFKTLLSAVRPFVDQYTYLGCVINRSLIVLPRDVGP